MKKIFIMSFVLFFSLMIFANNLADQVVKGYGTPVTYWYWYAWQDAAGNFPNGYCSPGSQVQISTSSFQYTYYSDHGFVPTTLYPVSLRMVAWDADWNGNQHRFTPTTGNYITYVRDSDANGYYWETWSRQTDSSDLLVYHWVKSYLFFIQESGPYVVNRCPM